MKKLKFILIFILSIGFFNSCLVDDTADIDLNGESVNLVTFNRITMNITGLADDSEYDFDLPIKIVGPTISELTNDITVTVGAVATSTAVDGVHYRIDNPTIVLTKANNYLGYLTVTMITLGNTPPMDGTPEFDDYVAPVLDLEFISVTGESNVLGSGKGGNITVNFTPPNPYAGDYDAYLQYWHPTAGGDYPPVAGGTPFVEETNSKTLEAITGRKCETGFATWYTTDLCWITCNVDNSISFVVDDTWPYDVSLGDPYDPTHVSYFDPADRTIHLYYTYVGSGGSRIFWEIFTPLF